MVFVEVYQNQRGDIYACYKNAITTATLINGQVTKEHTVPDANPCLVLKLRAGSGDLFALEKIPEEDGLLTLVPFEQREEKYERVAIQARRSNMPYAGHPVSSYIELYETATDLIFYPLPSNPPRLIDEPYVVANHLFVDK